MIFALIRLIQLHFSSLDVEAVILNRYALYARDKFNCLVRKPCKRFHVLEREVFEKPETLLECKEVYIDQNPQPFKNTHNCKLDEILHSGFIYGNLVGEKVIIKARRVFVFGEVDVDHLVSLGEILMLVSFGRLRINNLSANNIILASVKGDLMINRCNNANTVYSSVTNLGGCEVTVFQSLEPFLRKAILGLKKK